MFAHFIRSEKTILFTSATVLMVLVYPIYDDRLSRSLRRIFAPLEKSHRNHRSYVYKEALSGTVFAFAAQELSGIVRK